MVLAPVAADRVGDLRQLLASMNRGPGIVRPANTLIPFAQFATLHFARLVVLKDMTQIDIMAYGLPPGNYPTYLAFFDSKGEPASSYAVCFERCRGSWEVIRHERVDPISCVLSFRAFNLFVSKVRTVYSFICNGFLEGAKTAVSY
jgi:hypothetical protein